MFGKSRDARPVDIPDDWAPPTWEQLVNDHTDMVYRVAFRLTGNRQDAEDLTQDVFVRAFSNVHRFQPGTIEGWLRRITTNLFLDHARRRQRLRFDPMNDDSERVVSGEPGPAQTCNDANLDHDVARALADLPPDYRVAVVLCDIEGLSYDEIASVLDLRLGTVRSRIHRGRAQLRASLDHRRPTIEHHSVGAPDELPGQARDIDTDPLLERALRR